MAKSSEAGDTMTPPLEACSVVKDKGVTSTERSDHECTDAAGLLLDRGYRLGPKLGKVSLVGGSSGSCLLYVLIG